MKLLKKIRSYLFDSVGRFKREIKGKETLVDRVLYYMRAKYTDFIIVPYETVCRFCFWGWKLRNAYEFQCESIYLTIYLQLKQMIDYSKEYAHLCWNSNYEGSEFRKLRIASCLAKRLYEDDYNIHMKNHDKKWGCGQYTTIENKETDRTYLEIKRKNIHNEKDKLQHSKEYRLASDADEKQKSNERKYLYKLLEKHLESWWD